MRNLVSIMSATPQYGIGVAKNRFELFDEEEEEDPLELLKRREQEKEERRKAKLAEKENKSKQVPPSKSKPQKVLKETQKTKAPVEIQKPREEKKVKIRKDNDSNDNRGFNNAENKDYSSDRKWLDEDGHIQENGVSNERREYSGDGFQRGRGGRRGLPRGVFVRGGGGGGRGERGGGGGGRGGFQRFDSRGKREYDRQSGSDKTGVKPVDKRDGGGAHNWGSAQDDWQNQQQDDWQNQNDEWSNQQDEWSNPNQDASNLDKSPKPEERGENEQPQPEQGNESSEAPKDEDAAKTEGGMDDKPEMTLDEWKALKAPKKQQPSYNIRKPGEGEDLTRWKKMYALNKKKEDEEDTDDEYEYEIGEYPQRVGRQKRILDIDIKFKDARGGERGRGRGFGRGGPRGARNPSYNREVNHDRDRDRSDLPPAPKVDDEKDFPSLA